MGEWVLVGVATSSRGKIRLTDVERCKVLGPFAEADDARAVANSVAMGGDVVWTVVPLSAPDTVVR